MKIITKEEEDAHYAAVVRGGLVGGAAGLAAGLVGVTLASRRYAGFRGLTTPVKAALVVSSTTAASVVVAERRSIASQRARDPSSSYRDEASRLLDSARAQREAAEGPAGRLREWGRENRYSLVLASWLASMGASLWLVGRNRYLTTSQKVVQARMYAQGLTLLVLGATAALETSDARAGRGRWETVMVVDPNDPEHKHMIAKQVHKEDYAGQDLWKDMVATEERRLEKQKEARTSARKALDAGNLGDAEEKAPAPTGSAPGPRHV